MTYSTQRVGDVWVISLYGEVWGGWDSIGLKEAISELVDDGGRKILIDLARTQYVNSNGLGILVAIVAMLSDTPARLLLASVSSRTQRALRVTGVLRLFEMYRTRDEALRAFAESSAQVA